jgi:hypothetical protein
MVLYHLLDDTRHRSTVWPQTYLGKILDRDHNLGKILDRDHNLGKILGAMQILDRAKIPGTRLVGTFRILSQGGERGKPRAT